MGGGDLRNLAFYLPIIKLIMPFRRSPAETIKFVFRGNGIETSSRERDREREREKSSVLRLSTSNLISPCDDSITDIYTSYRTASCANGTANASTSPEEEAGAALINVLSRHNAPA